MLLPSVIERSLLPFVVAAADPDGARLGPSYRCADLLQPAEPTSFSGRVRNPTPTRLEIPTPLPAPGGARGRITIA
jgi:hypothetical protein